MGCLTEIAEKLETLVTMHHREIQFIRENEMIERRLGNESEDEAEPFIRAVRELQQKIDKYCEKLNALYEEYKF
ncbi:MAG: hypothetical protein Q6363_009340 [Candidatus Njordarchaeota archaeon]